ncbi:10579_t:CDS:10 [Racocetra fulgida]|uniref:10579_t:CDS:1 n=1 Tax=Racocetra fulgida TaxID=60492 RepID=A0A9N8WFK1_9GLOM|nr:10579_t:CDS:10 [Racocetra fulgida]
MATPEEDYSSLPLTERITHKVWKVRVAAYEELTKKFSQADPNESEFRPYEGFMKNIATDANAVAQETGLSTLQAYVENAPNPIKQGLGSSRAGTKNKAVELILTYIEVDVPDPVVVKLYKWLGQAINPHLQELKPVQVKELNEAFEKLPKEKVTQQRFLRSQKETEEAEKDVYDLAEPVDVLAKIPKDFYTQVALDALLEICKTPRIADNNYGELIAALTKRISDSNILVVTLAANIIEALALGLREAFAKYKPTVTNPLIEKLKERKQSVVDALAAALDAIFSTVTISDVTEDIVAAGKHKNPQVKSETMKWLVRCLKNTKLAPNKAEIKSLTEMMVKASEDSFEPVRLSAAEAAATQTPKAKPAAKTASKKNENTEPKKAAEPPKISKTAAQPPKKVAKPPTSAAPPKKGAKTKEEEPLRYKFSNEEVESRFAEIVPEEQTAELGDKNWKNRLAAYDPLRKAKSPKVLADSLLWFHGAIMEFGIAGVQVRELIDFIKFALTSSNAAVRTNAVAVLGALRIYVDIRTFVQDLNPTQLATIDAEFEKVADQAPPQPIKTRRGGNDALEELFPKVDIGAQFTSKMMADANDDKWKTRKEALEQVLAIVDANKRIKPNLVLVGPVTSVLTDQKATVRGSAISCLECLASATGLDPMVSSFATSLGSENPLLRKDLLNWFSDRLKDADEKNNLPDLQILVPPLLSCLQDRNGDVRKAAQSCLGPVVKSAGYDFVVTKCGDLKGAVKQTIMPMIEAVRPAHGTGPLPRGKDSKKLGAKSRLAVPSSSKDGKNSETDASDDIDEDDTPKLPPGLKLKPPASSAQGIPTRSIAMSHPTSTNDTSSSGLVPPNGQNSLAANNAPPSSLIPPNKLSSPAQRGGLPPSGIGRGLPAPSRLQFSRFRQGPNGQTSSQNDNSDDNSQKKEYTSMDIDKVDYSTATNSESPAVVNSSGIPPARQRTSERGNVFLVEVAISKIMSFEHQQSIEALKELDKHLNTSPESIIPYVDELVNALTIQVRMSYTQLDPQSQILVRLCKHLVNALVLLFSNKNLALAVSQESLERLLSELAHRLLDLNLQVLEAGQQLSKALNVSMVKVLENSNRNATYREVDAAAATTHTKFTELIMKCLWKLARSVQENLKSGILLPNKLLRDLNNFFLAIPPAEWKRRASEKVPLGEMPLRTVKTLLVELVTDLIDDPQRSYVYPYLHHMLEACRKKEKQPTNTNIPFDNSPSRPSSIGSVKSVVNDTTFSNFEATQVSSSREQIQSPSPRQINEVHARGSPIPEVPGQISETQYNSSEPASPASPMTPRFPTPTSNSRSSGSHEVEMNSRLTQIFLKIGTREETKQGIYELYEFQKQHPEMESKVTSHLSKTGPYFQSYIRRGLANIAAEEEEKERANVIAEVKTLFPLAGNAAEGGQTEGKV